VNVIEGAEVAFSPQAFVIPAKPIGVILVFGKLENSDFRQLLFSFEL
jgi:hypothetical protein